MPFFLHRKKYKTLVLFMVIIFCVAHSQTDAQTMADTLQEVKIKNRKKEKPSSDERINSFSNGQKKVSPDSAVLAQYKMQSVATLLAQQMPVFIKSYGLNGLATLNIRGSSAAQSQVFWNGVPINDGALGMADVSLLPVSMIQKLHMVYGSSAALWGSGNIGGTLVLENDTLSFAQKPTYDLSIGGGSFGQIQTAAKLSVGSDRISSQTHVFAQRAENNFQYTDDFGQSRNTENAQLSGLALQQQIGFKINDANRIKLIGWWQGYEREIPAALFESYSEKKRKDESLRLLAEWTRKRHRTQTYVRTAFINNKLRYDDDTIDVHTENSSYQYFFEAGWGKKINAQHQILIFTPIQISWIKPDNILKRQSKYALALAYSYRSKNEKLGMSANLRSEFINSLSVSLPGISASYNIIPEFMIRAGVQKTFRAPTLNELYYTPGGNEDLKPENGWSEEAGYRLHIKTKKNISLTHDVAVYNRVIDDWIIWLGGAIWTPHNLATVHSRGLETENRIVLQYKEWRFHLSVNASYVSATTQSSYLPDDGSIGKQIPYTPQLSGQANAGFTWKSLYVNYNHCYTGKRFINMDETGALPRYQTANLQVNYTRSFGSKSISLFAQLNNLFNSPYEIVRGRPMPGLNWMGGVRFY